MAENDLTKFLETLAESLSRATFVKATVGNYKGPEDHLQKVLLRPVKTRKGALVQFVFRYRDRDLTRNFEPEEVSSRVEELLRSGFRSATLFTTEGDHSLIVSKKGRAFLSASEPTFREAPDTAHDRKKSLAVDAGAPFLRALGITTGEGRVRDKQQAKFRQINRFVEIVGGLLSEARLDVAEKIRVVDMGSGKGYLTFALYDHLARSPGITDAEVVGVEQRGELVDVCRAAADECGFRGLSFVRGTIGETDVGSADVLIALHACDTATDDAIFEGLRTGARVIVTAPCCQKEIRGQLRFPDEASRLNSFGLLLEQETESITDGIRAILLEDCGYSVKMIDFVSPEHTPKNTLIAAVRKEGGPVRFEGSPDSERLMRLFGITSQRLYTLLNSGGLP